jgi:hypothetical protein
MSCCRALLFAISIIIERKVGVYSSGKLKCWNLSLRPNIRLGWKFLVAINGLAYNYHRKSFITLNGGYIVFQTFKESTVPLFQVRSSKILTTLLPITSFLVTLTITSVSRRRRGGVGSLIGTKKIDNFRLKTLPRNFTRSDDKKHLKVAKKTLKIVQK